MEPNEREREDLAVRIADERLRRYKGSRKAAYNDARVNSSTWTRAEEGLPIAERSRVAIILTLWPETGGDWRRMEPPLGLTDQSLEPAVEDTELAAALAELDAANLSDAARATIMRILDAERSAPEGTGKTEQRGTA